MTRSSIYWMLLVVIFSLPNVYLHAQPGDPNEDPQVPISGIGLLLAAGAAYGAKKVYDVYRKKNH